MILIRVSSVRVTHVWSWSTRVQRRLFSRTLRHALSFPFSAPFALSLWFLALVVSGNFSLLHRRLRSRIRRQLVVDLPVLTRVRFTLIVLLLLPSHRLMTWWRKRRHRRRRCAKRNSVHRRLHVPDRRMRTAVRWHRLRKSGAHEHHLRVSHRRHGRRHPLRRHERRGRSSLRRIAVHADTI